MTSVGPKTVLVNTPEGGVWEVPENELGMYESKGYSALSPEQNAAEAERASFADQGLEAGVAGAARGLTFGVSDYVATEAGWVTPDYLNKLKIYQPEASSAGEIGGSVASMLIPGAALARAAKGLSTGAKLAYLALGDAGLGAASATGEMISQRVLEDRDFTAEQIVAHMGDGALWAGGLSLGFGAAGLAAKSFAKSATAETIAQKITKNADQVSVGSLNLTEKQIRTLTAQEGGIEDFAKFIRAKQPELGGERFFGKTAEELSSAVDTYQSAVGSKLDDLYRSMDKSGAVIDGEKFVQEIEDSFLGELRKKVGRHNSQLVTQMDATLGTIRAQGKMTPSQVREIRRDLQASVKKSMSAGDDAIMAASAEAESDISFELSKRLDSVSQSVFAGSGLAEKSSTFRDLNRKLARSYLIEQAAGRQVSKSYKGVGLGDLVTLAGGATAGAGLISSDTSLGDAASALGGALAAKYVRSKGAAQMLDGLDRLALFVRAGMDTQSKISNGVRGIAAGIKAGALAGVTRGSTYEDRVENAKYLVEHLDSVIQTGDLENVPSRLGSLSEDFPSLANALTSHSQKAVEYLRSQAPRPTPGQTTILPEKWAPAPSELVKWELKVRTVASPLTALNDFAKGKIRPEQVDAIRAVYPKMWEMMLTTASEYVSRKKLGREGKLRLSRTLGVPVDGSVRIPMPNPVSEDQASTAGSSTQTVRKTKLSPLTTDTQSVEFRRQ